MILLRNFEKELDFVDKLTNVATLQEFDDKSQLSGQKNQEREN